jgi:hypothetical protein
MKSNAAINATIAVTCVAIVTVMVGLVSSLFFRTRLDSPIYYGIVLVLTFVTILLAMFQIWPRLLVLLRPGGKRLIPPLATDTESEIDALERIDLDQHTRKRLLEASSSKELNLKKKLEGEGEQNLPIKVTMEVRGTPVTIESPDLRSVETLVEQLALISAKYHAKETREAGKSRVSANPAVGQIQPGTIREDKETYQADNPAEKS